MRISDWSSDVCSSDLRPDERFAGSVGGKRQSFEQAMAAHASACATPRTAWPPPRRSLNYSTDKSGLFVAVAFRIAHQCFRNDSRIPANSLLEPVEKPSLFLERQEQLRVGKEGDRQC